MDRSCLPALVGRPFECRQTSRKCDSIISNGKSETTDGDGETGPESYVRYLVRDENY